MFLHKDSFSHDGTKSTENIFSNGNESESNKKILIICATVILCVIIIAGAFLLVGSNSNNADNANANIAGNANQDNSGIDGANNDSNTDEGASQTDNGNRYENFSREEWDQSSYAYGDIYTAHTPEDVKREMFDKADFNGDGVLTGDEIKEMDYLLKHSEYTYNGPGMAINGGTISTGSAKSDKTYCSVYVGSGYAGENVKISVLYSRDGKNLNQGNIVPKTVDSEGYVSVPSAKAFKKYPDEAYITLYDSNGNTIDTQSVSLSPKSGSQSF